MIIPSIDLLDNSIVKLRRGNRYSQIIVPISEKEDILSKVEEYSKHFRALHVVNLNGAICQDKFIGKSLFHEVIQHATSLGLNVQAGGGIATPEDAEQILEFCPKIVIGTLAVRNPKAVLELCEKYPGRIVVALDCLGERVLAEGWVVATWQTPNDAYVAFSEVAEVLMTQVSVEGMGVGPDLKFYSDFLQKHPKALLHASGGVRNRKDVEELYKIGVTNIIIGKALFTKEKEELYEV